MSEFIDKMIGSGTPKKRQMESKTTVTTADQLPDLAKAMDVLMFYAMNSPTRDGGGVREVGEKVTILLPNVEVLAVNQRTGEQENITIGHYEITITRVS